MPNLLQLYIFSTDFLQFQTIRYRLSTRKRTGRAVCKAFWSFDHIALGPNLQVAHTKRSLVNSIIHFLTGLRNYLTLNFMTFTYVKVKSQWEISLKKSQLVVNLGLIDLDRSVQYLLLIVHISHFEIAIYHCIMGLFWGNKGTVPQNSPIRQCNVAIPRPQAQLRSG